MQGIKSLKKVNPKISERNLLSIINSPKPNLESGPSPVELMKNRKANIRRASSGVNYFTGQMKFQNVGDVEATPV